jgi:magnesium transporter
MSHDREQASEAPVERVFRSALTAPVRAVSKILGPGRTSTGGKDESADGSAIIDCALYLDGKRQGDRWDYREALNAARRGQGFVWLGLHEPKEAEFADIAAAFDLHELPVEDAIKSYQRPKIEQYGNMTFAVLRTTRYVEHKELTENSEVVESGWVMLFIGRHFVISVRHGTGGELSSVRADLEAKPDLLGLGPWAVAHAAFDRVVDLYVDCAVSVEQDIDALEESVFSRSGNSRIQRIYQLKRELMEFKRAVLPLQRPLTLIVDGRVPEVPPSIRAYFRDVNDHLTRTVEQTLSFDDLLNSILQARLAQVTVDQNNDMRKIAAWAGIAAVWTAIAGVYGMNFDNMPELHTKFGYPIVLLIMVGWSVVLYRWFRKSGWL